jgi:prepilin-type N-terminal cleavage/methylation domain-containing protein
MKNHKTQKGFTLIELLVVIAIIAILAVVVVLTLNPAQLLAQARDSNRISDFATIKSALALYGTDVATTTAMNNGTNALYTGNMGSPTALPATTSTYYEGAGATAWGFATGYVTSVVETASRLVNGTSGWIPVNLSAISAGAPIGVWPVDPVNSGALMYIYAATTTSFKLATKMESTKYQANGANDVVSTDGGNNSTTYEQGSNLAL